MGPALQVHTPPKKKQRGAPDGALRVFRPCVAQTEEGYIRRFYKREPRDYFKVKVLLITSVLVTHLPALVILSVLPLDVTLLIS